MTNDAETQPDIFDNEEQDDKSLSDCEDFSGASLSSTPDLNQPQAEEEVKNEDLAPELHDQINESLRINENKKEDDLTQFIITARQQGFNCLDLSKRNIKEFPSQLLEFTSLQVNIFKYRKITFFFFFLVSIFRR
jgi:hypothetical protein